MEIQKLSQKEPQIEEFYKWLFEDERIIDKSVILENEVDLSLVHSYSDARIYYPRQISRFFETSAMKRLGRISQLASVIVEHPNANHNRLEHCKGAYNRKLEEFLYDFQNPNWRKYIEENHLKLYVFGDLIKIAGHDIRHFPLSHAFESSVFQKYGIHEIVGEKILLEDKELLELYNSISPALPEVMKKLLRTNIFNFSNHDEGNYDVDRLDYLSRDGMYLKSPQNFRTYPYHLTQVASNPDGTPKLNEDGSIIESSEGTILIDVYDYKYLRDLENFLRIRYKSYKNIYVSEQNYITELANQAFLEALLSNYSPFGYELQKYIHYLKSIDIRDIDIEEFKKWDDISYYSQIIEVAQNHADENVQALATISLPPLKSFLTLLYCHLKLYEDKSISQNDLELIKKIKNIIKGNDTFSKNMKNPNFRYDNTINLSHIPTSTYTLDTNLIHAYSYTLKGYSKKAPLYIRDKHGKAYELCNHPERSLDWSELSEIIHSEYAYIPYLRFNHFSEDEIQKFINLQKKYFPQSFTPPKKDNTPKISMKTSLIGHRVEDCFAEL